MDQPSLRQGRLVRAWVAALGGEVLYAEDLPACCHRSSRDVDGLFECPSCGGVWQAAEPVEPVSDAFMEFGQDEERKGAA